MDDVQRDHDRHGYDPYPARAHPGPAASEQVRSWPAPAWPPPDQGPPGWGPPQVWVPLQTGGGLGTASMVVGIVALMGAPWFFFAIFFAGVPGVVAVVLGVVTLVRAHRHGTAGRGQAIAGVVCGGLAVLAALLWVLVYVGLLASAIFLSPDGSSFGSGPSA